jgi:hypothetical protein
MERREKAGQAGVPASQLERCGVLDLLALALDGRKHVVALNAFGQPAFRPPAADLIALRGHVGGKWKVVTGLAFDAEQEFERISSESYSICHLGAAVV